MHEGSPTAFLVAADSAQDTLRARIGLPPDPDADMPFIGCQYTPVLSMAIWVTPHTSSQSASFSNSSTPLQSAQQSAELSSFQAQPLNVDLAGNECGEYRRRVNFDKVDGDSFLCEVALGLRQLLSRLTHYSGATGSHGVQHARSRSCSWRNNACGRWNRGLCGTGERCSQYADDSWESARPSESSPDVLMIHDRALPDVGHIATWNWADVCVPQSPRRIVPFWTWFTAPSCNHSSDAWNIAR